MLPLKLSAQNEQAWHAASRVQDVDGEALRGSNLAGGELNVGSIAGRFPISFNGVSKHVKVLERAGLVHRRVRGREHWLRLRPEPLREATRWLEHYREFWEARLDALEALLVGTRGHRP